MALPTMAYPEPCTCATRITTALELYVDRPPDQWPRTPTGNLAMTSDPLISIRCRRKPEFPRRGSLYFCKPLRQRIEFRYLIGSPSNDHCHPHDGLELHWRLRPWNRK